MRIRIAAVLLILSIISSGLWGTGKASAASVVMTTPLSSGISASSGSPAPVCVFYYGGLSSSVKQSLKANPPQFVILNTPGGSYKGISNPTPSEIDELQAVGIKVFSYVSTGNLVQFMYNSSSPSNTFSYVRGCIDSVAAEGCDGIFFDEGGVGNYRDSTRWPHGSIADINAVAPAVDLYGAANSWSGYTIKTGYLDYCHSKGLLACMGTAFRNWNGSYNLNPNCFSVCDFILTDEEYIGRVPDGAEVGNGAQCWVIGSSINNGSTAASYTNSAISKGFAAAYECPSYGTFPSWYASYLSQVNGTPSTSYTLTIATGSGGTTNPTSGTYTVSAGNSMTVTATPNSGYHFTGWSNGSTVNPITLTINSNTSVTASFALDTVTNYSLVIGTNTGGTTNPVPGTYSESSGSSVTITATPNSGYHFTGWSNGSTVNPITLTINSNTSVTASFTRDTGTTYTLQVAVQNNVGGTTNPTPGTYTVPSGTMETVTAIPVSGYKFKTWTWPGANSDYAGWTQNPTSWTMTESTTIIAVFEQVSTENQSSSENGGSTSDQGQETNNNSNIPVNQGTIITNTQNIGVMGYSSGGITGPGMTDMNLYTNGRGYFNLEATASSEDGKAQVVIGKGVQAESDNNTGPLKAITIKPVDEAITAADGIKLIGTVYDFSPDGTVFDPPVTLKLRYDAEQIPTGVTEEDLVIARWDETANKWEELSSIVDSETKTVSTTSGHFSRYGIVVPRRPAVIAISNLEVSPDKLGVKEPVTVTVTVSNTGDESGSREIILDVKSGAGIESLKQVVEVGGGESKEVTFSINEADAGDYTVEVEGLSGAFTIEGGMGQVSLPEVGLKKIQPEYINNQIVSIKGDYEIKNPKQEAEEGELLLKVYLDGEPLESKKINTGVITGARSLNGSFDYMPTSGWVNGTYTVSMELYYDGVISSVSPSNILEIKTGKVTVVSWYVLGLIISVMLMVATITIVVILRRRSEIIKSWVRETDSSE
jgi:hypothetical protein